MGNIGKCSDWTAKKKESQSKLHTFHKNYIKQTRNFHIKCNTRKESHGRKSKVSRVIGLDYKTAPQKEMLTNCTLSSLIKILQFCLWMRMKVKLQKEKMHANYMFGPLFGMHRLKTIKSKKLKHCKRHEDTSHSKVCIQMKNRHIQKIYQ